MRYLIAVALLFTFATTVLAADDEMIVKVYPVQDLLVVQPQDMGVFSPMMMFGGNQYGNQAQYGRQGGRQQYGQNNGQFGNQFGNQYQQPNARQTSPAQDKAKELIDVITETVCPDEWRVNGGKATIKYFNGCLVVRAPAKVHQQLQ